MKHLYLMAKIVAGIAVLIGVFMVSHIVSKQLRGEVLEGSDVVEENADVTVLASQIKKPKSLVIKGDTINELSEKLRRAAKKSDYEPGERAFSRACDLLATEFYDEAEVKLKELISRYPYAPSVPEARRILGQRNIDRVFTDSQEYGKTFYKVVPGDSFNKISRKFETSLDNIKLLNGLYTLGKLHVGEELLVMPLHFNVVVDLPNSRVTLEYGKKFVKDYPFLKFIGKPRSKDVKTTIQVVEAQVTRGRTVSALSDSYRSAEKVIVVRNPRSRAPLMEIVGHNYQVDDIFEGVILDSADIEELAVILRAGNLVEVRY